MKPMFMRATRAFLIVCGLLGGAASATTPVVTPQKGAAALVTLFHVRTELPRQLDTLTFATRDYVDRALRLLAPAASPSQVMAAPAGVTLACPAGGSVIARLSARAPRLLKLQWVDCASEAFELRRILNGVGEVTLLDSTFTPAAVASITLGNRSSDFLEEDVYLMSEQPPDLVARNLRMIGYIPLARADENDAFRGTSLHELTGFYELRTKFLVGDPQGGDQLFENKFTVTAEHLFVHSQLEAGVNELGVIGGNLSFVWDYPETPAEPAHIDRFSIDPGSLRLRELVDDTTFDRTFEIDGAVRITMPDFLNFGCYSKTDFSFRTTVPLHYTQPIFGPDDFDAGEIWINGTARARFSFPPDGMAATRVDFDTREGSFDFRVPADGGWVALLPVAACRR